MRHICLYIGVQILSADGFTRGSTRGPRGPKNNFLRKVFPKGTTLSVANIGISGNIISVGCIFSLRGRQSISSVGDGWQTLTSSKHSKLHSQLIGTKSFMTHLFQGHILPKKTYFCLCEGVQSIVHLNVQSEKDHISALVGSETLFFGSDIYTFCLRFCLCAYIGVC